MSLAPPVSYETQDREDATFFEVTHSSLIHSRNRGVLRTVSGKSSGILIDQMCQYGGNKVVWFYPMQSIVRYGRRTGQLSHRWSGTGTGDNLTCQKSNISMDSGAVRALRLTEPAVYRQALSVDRNSEENMKKVAGKNGGRCRRCSAGRGTGLFVRYGRAKGSLYPLNGCTNCDYRREPTKGARGWGIARHSGGIA
ncbi:hypothetical protein BC826DRAFT_973601 [Russula brevipes]|nr:hypothetical protein BC826DRAFT_973601 [Russula brevipes]